MYDPWVDVIQSATLVLLGGASIANTIKLRRLERRVDACTCSVSEHPPSGD